MSQGESIAHLEESTIQPIPLTERHGSAKDLFTIWFGSNIMMLTIVTGSLATTVFKQPFWWAALATLVGSLIGAVFMALHSAQGPQLGVPQMIQTRGQFGSFGALLVVGLVVVMYVGFFASNCVFGGQALHSLNAGIPLDAGVVVIGLISLLGSIYGYKLIHAYARLLSWCSGSVLVLAFVWIIFVHGLPADTFSKHSLNLSGFLGAMSVAALWQIAYAPYVSDYSRYLPPDTGRTAFWSSYWGCVLGSFFPMLLGCLVGLATPDGNVVSGLTGLTQGISVLVIVVLSFGIAASNAMELYCGALSAITVLQTPFHRGRARRGRGRSPRSSCAASRSRSRCSGRTISSPAIRTSSCCCCTCSCRGPRSTSSTITSCVTASTTSIRSSGRTAASTGASIRSPSARISSASSRRRRSWRPISIRANWRAGSAARTCRGSSVCR